jgi:hypothetical protein
VRFGGVLERVSSERCALWRCYVKSTSYSP